ncbi:MAG: hypothetical protein R2764_24120 [Bacteroidales bacterium]
MIIFAQKHFSSKNAWLFSFFINLAVYFRAFLALFYRFFSKAIIPLIDATLLAAGIIGIKSYWEHIVIFPEGGNYPSEIVSVAIPFYIFIWLFSVFLSGGYDKPVNLAKIFRGLFIGSVIILTVYALLPEAYRFSRALIVFGALWGFISMIGLRYLLHLAKVKKYRIGTPLNKRFAIVGNHEEAERVSELIRKADMKPGFIGFVYFSEQSKKEKGFIGNINQLKDIINIYKIDEVIFCAKDLPMQQIIDKMSELNAEQVEFKIAPPESLAIIGSQSISTSGDVYIIELDSITKINNRRSKRFFDLLTSLFLLSLSPLLVFFQKKPIGFFQNIFRVFFGLWSWVGFRLTSTSEQLKLPVIKPGILNPTDAIKNTHISADTIDRLNLLYARDYKIMNDLNILLKGFRKLGRTNDGSNQQTEQN